MRLSFAMLLVALTSILGYKMVNRIGSVSVRSLVHGVGAFLDWAGLFALFLTGNLALGVLFILTVRGLTPFFVSLYELETLVLLLLSAAQAFVFHHSWKRV